MTIFQSGWWLDAAANGAWELVRFELPSGQAAQLPIFRRKHYGLTLLEMPPLTRTLGPQVEGVAGKPESVRRMTLALLEGIISQLPRHHVFHQLVDPDFGDLLAFKLHGFDIGVEYTFRIADCADTDRVWKCMRDKTRNVIRRAREAHIVRSDAMTADDFVDFIFTDLARSGRKPVWPDELYRRVVKACLSRDCGTILSARNASGLDAGAIFVAWDDRTMYHLLTAKDPVRAGNGTISLLIWEALKFAAAKRLVFDFDGFASVDGARFIIPFGGDLTPRWRVSRVARAIRPFWRRGEMGASETKFGRTAEQGGP